MQPKRFLMICAVVLATTMTAMAQKVAIIEGLYDAKLQTAIETNTTMLLENINNACENNLDKVPLNDIRVNAETSNAIQKLWRNGHFKCTRKQMNMRCLKTYNGYQLRGIKVNVYPAQETNGNEPENIEKKLNTPDKVDGKEVYEEVVINYDRNGQINSFLFSLDPEIYGQAGIGLLQNSKNAVKEESNRQMVLNFVEQFRTAYNLKDLDFLNKIYSDSALIIKGVVVETRKNSDDSRSMRNLSLNKNDKRIEYQVMNKSQYLKDLKYTFDHKSYINVEFDSVVITKHPSLEYYGVQVKQKWRTNNYSDDGYVFLLWDFRNPDAPEVRIRTWQPEFVDKQHHKRLPREDIFGLGDFRFRSKK